MDRETALKAYSLMVTSRAIDDRCKQLLADRQAVPNYHSGTGQEAMSVGIGLAAQPNDYLLYTYRDFGMLLAKGLDLDALVGDLLLRTSGSTRGHGGIMHVVAPELGIVGRNGVFGSRFGIAIGLALAAVRQGQHRVVLCPFGEAEGSRGPLYEALNIACLSKLPVLFVAENNGFSISARTESIYAAGDMSGSWRGAPLPVSKIDGNDMHAVHSAAAVAIEHCRGGLGPFYLECMTYRIDPHIPIDTEAYRGREEVDAWRLRDPIDTWAAHVVDAELATEEELAKARDEASERVGSAFARAAAAPHPDLRSMEDYVYYSKNIRVRTRGANHG